MYKYIDADEPYFVDVYEYDACNVLIQMEWEGACNPAPPPNEECEFYSGFQFLNLSTIKGQTLDYVDSNDAKWLFTPCANGLDW